MLDLTHVGQKDSIELKLIYEKQSKLQSIKLYTDSKDRLVLTLDSYIQFVEGEDEQIYHDMLTRPAFEMNNKAKRFLILGGGDGLVSRNILKLQPKANITLVDYDEELVWLCMTHKRITKLNENSLFHCNIRCKNALDWVVMDNNKYDIIILDFPDPNSDELNKLYQKDFIAQTTQLLKDDGVISIQAHDRIADKIYQIVSQLTKETKNIDYDMPFLDGGHIIVGKGVKKWL